MSDVLRVIELESEVYELRTMNGRLARRIGGITTQLNEELGPEIKRQRAEAWDEGHRCGFSDAQDAARHIIHGEHNPYRKEEGK